MVKRNWDSESQGPIGYIKELWQSRELLWILAKRDVLVKYKQTVLGIGWSVVRPLVMTIVMSFAFGKVAKLNQSADIPFTLIVMPGVLVWMFFSQSLTAISQSIVSNANLVTKVYFPRLIIPLSTIFLGLIDVSISIALFFGLCLWYHFVPDFKIIFIPFLLICCFLISFSVGLISAVLNVKYRDIGQIIPFVIQFGMYISPVAYLSESVTQNDLSSWKSKLFLMNPITGVIDAMRWCMLGNHAEFNWFSFNAMCIFIVLMTFFALKFFKKHENSFVDYI